MLVWGCSIEREILNGADGRHGLADVGEQFIVTRLDGEILEKAIGLLTGEDTTTIASS